MSAFKVVRDSANRVRGCGPNDDSYNPSIPPDGSLSVSDVFLPIDLTPEESSEQARKTAIVSDPLRANLLNAVKTATNAQISNYVDNNVTDLASARTMFKRILLLISLDQRDGG
jgi:hypothetical protein